MFRKFGAFAISACLTTATWAQQTGDPQEKSEKPPARDGMRLRKRPRWDRTLTLGDPLPHRSCCCYSIALMLQNGPPSMTVGKWALFAAHVGLLALPLVAASSHGGVERVEGAFWGILVFFVGIALEGTVMLGIRFIRAGDHGILEAAKVVRKERPSH